MTKFRFQAHRGDSAFYPENTLVSYDAAIKQGYDIIEIDTKFTDDNVCVCLHDATLNRTARTPEGSEIAEKTPIIKVTYEEAKKYDYGLFKGEEFKGTQMCTLAEALAFIKKSTLDVKLDNVFQKFNEEQFELFCQVIEEADMEDRIGLTCKTIPYMNYLAARFPKAEIHYDGSLTPAALEECGKLTKAGRRVTIWIPYDNENTAWFRGRKADEEFCRELHQYGEVGIWLISEPEELEVARNQFGADAIETNGTLKPTM
ncbi:MAG: hypothetical protein IJX94_05330 [Clostridia bacterium]|nr:hypothetical protein [Clostridia bacterium]